MLTLSIWHRNIARDTCREQPGTQKDSASINSSGHNTESATSGGSVDDPAYYSDLQNIENWNSGGGADDPAYYNDMQNVGDWTKENESERLDTYSTESDHWEDKLSAGHKTLRNSEAYVWLISTVQRIIHMNGVQSSYMESHRQWLLTMLEANISQKKAQKHWRISRRRRPALYTAKFELSWDLLGSLRKRGYAEENLFTFVGRVITLSGDHQSVQALPCKEYMEQIWPSAGADFIRLLERAVETPNQLHECTLIPFVSNLVIQPHLC